MVDIGMDDGVRGGGAGGVAGGLADARARGLGAHSARFALAPGRGVQERARRGRVAAAGRCAGFFEPGLSPWDIAGGMILVSEAGGFATDYSGHKSPLNADAIVAGNADIHRLLVDMLAKSRSA